MDLALNDLQRLICHKTQPTNHLLKSLTIFIIIIERFTSALADGFSLESE